MCIRDRQYTVQYVLYSTVQYVIHQQLTVRKSRHTTSLNIMSLIGVNVAYSTVQYSTVQYSTVRTVVNYEAAVQYSTLKSGQNI